MSKPIGEMNHQELEAHIKEKDEKHRKEMTHLRALLKVLEDQQPAQPPATK